MRLRRSPLVAAVALLVATTLVPFAAETALADSTLDTNGPVNVRWSPSITAPVMATIPTGTFVTVSDTPVTGDPWSASCPGSVSGSTWYALTSVNGQSVQTLYGIPAAYAATGLFRPATFLEGIDVSTYQGTIDWNAVAASGKRFAIMRASLGTTYTDPTYASNHVTASAAGLGVAAYHYATPSADPNDAVNEATWFVQNAQLAVGDVIPALDLEQSGGLAPPDLIAWVESWLDQVYALTGVKAMIYTSPTFWSSGLGGTAQFANEGFSVLWVAHWDTLNPIVPGGSWGGQGWTFWQYSNQGSVPGISGRVDLDRFNGFDLSRVRITSITAPPPPIPQPTPAPSVSAIAPTTAAAGAGDVSLTIQGANFAPGASTAYWNGQPLGTTFVSTSLLQAIVPAAMTTTPGSASVMVVNAPTGASSPPTTFTVTLPPAQLTTLASTTIVVVGQQATVTAAISPNGPGRPVTLQALPANATDWTDVTTQPADDAGNVVFPVSPRVNTQYRTAFAGAPDLGAATSPPVRILVRSAITLRPTNSGRVKALPYGSRVTFSSSAQPTGTGVAPQKISFSFYRYISGRWVFLTKRDAYVDATGRASYTWTFNWRGQWYVRAVANSSGTNANSYPSQVERYSVY